MSTVNSTQPVQPTQAASMGAECHFKPGMFPVAAITDLRGNIIASNIQYETNSGKPKPVWTVANVKVVITRFWASSQASISLTCAVTDIDELPPPLDPFFRVEQDLCIYLGYIERIRPLNANDLGFKLLRVFIGIIDTFSRTITDTGGIVVKIMCRDRMKWLLDSVITLSPQGKSTTNIPTLGLGPGGSITNNEIYRSDLIIDIARRGIGQVAVTDRAIGNSDLVKPDTDCLDCGRKIVLNQAFLYDAGKNQDYRSIDVWYRDNGAPLRGHTRTDGLSVPENPDFRIYTARQPIKLKENLQFLITQKVPIEIIKMLALQEVNPTEVFQSHIDGHFYYVPRTSDISGLTDPKRFYRTYFVRNIPTDLQLLLNPSQQLPTGRDVIYGSAAAPVTYRGYTLKPNERVINGRIEQLTTSGTWETVTPQPRFDDTGYRPTAEQSAQALRMAVESVERTPFDRMTDVDFNQMVLRYKDELTSVGLKTSIQVRVMNDVNGAQQMAFGVHLRAYPWDLKHPDPNGQKPRFGCKVISWEDDTIESLAEAAVVALNLAKQYSREVRAATGVLLGDPSLTPGEVCQVVTPPLFPTDDWTKKLQMDRRQFFIFHYRSITYAQDYEAAIRTYSNADEITLPIHDDTTARFIRDREAEANEKALLCRRTSVVEDSKKDIGFNEEPRSIWRVEAVIHNFNVGAQGYRTEVAWVTPF